MANRDQAAKAQIRAREEIEQRGSLPESEWNFSQPPPEWQMYHWLNYEYARTSRSIVQGVLDLRAQRIGAERGWNSSNAFLGADRLSAACGPIGP